MNWENFSISIVFDLLLTVFAYLLVPTIVAFSGKKYEAKQIKRISIVNCVIVWILFRILQLALIGEASTGGAVFLWGYVGYWILTRKALKVTPSSQKPPSQNTSNAFSFSNLDDVSYVHSSHLTSGSDIALVLDSSNEDGSNSKAPNTHRVTPTIIHQTHHEPIDTKVSTEPRSLQKNPWRKFLIIVEILFFVSFAFNIYLFFDNQALAEENQFLTSENSILQRDLAAETSDKLNLQKSLANSSEKADFYERYVVLIADDETNLYHNYDCPRFQTCEYFWIYTLEEARDSGFEPCSCSK